MHVIIDTLKHNSFAGQEAIQQAQQISRSFRKLRTVYEAAPLVQEVRIWDMALAELSRQSYVHCQERGMLLERARTRVMMCVAFLERVVAAQAKVSYFRTCVCHTTATRDTSMPCHACTATAFITGSEP